MRKVRTFWLFLFILMLSSCEHKEFHYVSSRFYPLSVEFDWNRLTDHEKPEGMRVIFFPKVGTGEPWIFDFPHGEGQQIELPCNDYQAICMNYDTDGILWENPDSYWEFTALTRNVKTPDGEQASTTPSWMCGDARDGISLQGKTTDEQVITLRPVSRVSRYTYEVNGIRQIERIADVRASLSDMSASLLMAEDRLPGGASERLLFGGTVVGKQVKGGFYTFGCSQERREQNIFKLYIKSSSGKTYVLEKDVSEQVHAVPVSGHRGDVHLIINFDFEVPDKEHDGSGEDNKDNTGFDVGVDDWADVNEDIIC